MVFGVFVLCREFVDVYLDFVRFYIESFFFFMVVLFINFFVVILNDVYFELISVNKGNEDMEVVSCLLLKFLKMFGIIKG